MYKRQHKLTNAGFTQLRIDLKEADGFTGFGEWNDFKVAAEFNKYQLTVGKMVDGNIDNDLGRLNGLLFSTKDRDNDKYKDNCATMYKGG